MEYFLKRIPAFSRALGDIDSGSDDDDDSIVDQNGLDAPDNSLLFTNEQDEELNTYQIFRDYTTISHVILAIGPLTSAFVTIGTGITHKSLSVIKVSYKKTSLVFNSYYLPDYDNTLIICIEHEPKYLCYQHKYILCRYFQLAFCHNENFDKDKITIKDINVLCSRPVTQYSSKLKTSPPFIKCIPTYSGLSSRFPKLEEPTILTGLPAEALNWFYFKSLPVNVYIVFYLPHVSVCEWSAVKEIFNSLLPVGIEIMQKQFSSNNQWDSNLLSEKLKEMCITSVCNSERAKTDQMYT
ncbi:unnamed protein product [Schistosoma margrebowiei]|uniref:Uncharacterized protein n=1 Tax=Schistosoma margrebowiei TaxID=48269 RepID=A0A183MFU7_9TREM|nr:unnamed protein product [Schistosoma margrebowiei]